MVVVTEGLEEGSPRGKRERRLPEGGYMGALGIMEEAGLVEWERW